MLLEWLSCRVDGHEKVAVGVFEDLFMVFVVAAVRGQNPRISCWFMLIHAKCALSFCTHRLFFGGFQEFFAFVLDDSFIGRGFMELVLLAFLRVLLGFLVLLSSSASCSRVFLKCLCFVVSVSVMTWRTPAKPPSKLDSVKAPIAKASGSEWKRTRCFFPRSLIGASKPLWTLG